LSLTEEIVVVVEAVFIVEDDVVELWELVEFWFFDGLRVELSIGGENEPRMEVLKDSDPEVGETEVVVDPEFISGELLLLLAEVG